MDGAGHRRLSGREPAGLALCPRRGSVRAHRSGRRDCPSPAAPPRKLPFVLATSGGMGERVENPPMAAIDGDPKTGWGVTIVEEYNPFLALRFAEPVHTHARFGPDRAAASRFRSAPRHHRALPPGAFRRRLFLARGWRIRLQDQGQPARQSSAHLDRRGRPGPAARSGQDPAPAGGRAQRRTKGRRAGLLRILHAGAAAGLRAAGPPARRARLAVRRHPARAAYRIHASAHHAYSAARQLDG